MGARDRHTPLSLAILFTACGAGSSGSAPQSSDVDVVRPPASAAPDRQPPARQPSRARPIIEHDGIGDVRIGKPIPAHHLSDDRALLARYDIRWVADAQPFEAWRIEDPEVTAMFKGPFTRWAEDNVGELEPGRFVADAVRELRAGAPVLAILIESRAPRTHRGIGVGSTWAELVAAYPDAKILRSPESFDARATCTTYAADQPGVTFHLASCDGDPGDVVRVLIYPP